MKLIKGYVFIAEFSPHFKSLFGKGINREHFENIQTNGLIPYDLPEEVQKAKSIFLKERGNNANLISGKFEMKVAQSPQDLEVFKGESDLIVVWNVKDDISKESRLLGPIVNGQLPCSTLPGARLYNTGFQTFTIFDKSQMSPYERAEYLMKEVNRQGWSAATMAQFFLQKF